MLAFGTKTQRMRGGGGGGGRLFEAERLLTFSAFRMGAYSRWALIRGWALIRMNTVTFLYNSTEKLQTCPIFKANLVKFIKTLEMNFYYRIFFIVY